MKREAQTHWPFVQLATVADFRNGVNYSKSNFGTGIKVINVKDFQDYSIPQYEQLEQINPDGVVTKQHILLENDIIFVRSNGNRDLIGRSLIIKSLPETPVTHSAFTIRVRFISNGIDPSFCSYVFRTDLIRHTLSAEGNGANITNLNQDILSRLPIPCPPLPIQRRIASILSAYDDLIENNTRRIAILEEMARRLYEEWFVNFRFPGHETARFVETELGVVPEGWEIKTVGELFDILGGGTPSKNEASYWEEGSITWYSPSDLTRAKTIFANASAARITSLGLQKSSARLFPAYSVMLTSRATIGVIAINTTEACTNQGFITCLPNEQFPLSLLFHWLKNNVEKFICLGTGATFKEITKGTFKAIRLALPHNPIIKQFEMLTEPMLKSILVLENKNANLRTQRDLLLPKLISGELDVSEAEDVLEETAV